jgi:outer membrane lipoprotein-sorting protein
MLKKSLVLLALAFAISLPSTQATAGVPVAMAAIDPAEILAEVDRRMAAFDDQSYAATMEIIKSGQLKKTLEFKSSMKGLDKQFIEFVAPGDVAGMKVLLDGSDLYIYTPEFQKVRRVAAHMQSQGFMGSEFQLADIGIKLSPTYDAALGSTDGSLTTLVLTPKAGKEAAFPKIELTIDGTKGGVTKLVYFDASGNAVRQQTREDWVKIDGKLIPTTVSMMNLKTGDVSVIRMSDIKVNQGLGDDVFSRRQLLR